MTCNSQGRHTVVATSQVTYPAEGIFFSLFSVAMESIASAMLLVIINTVCLNRWLVFNFWELCSKIRSGGGSLRMS